jgi:hypothetical protein
MLFLALSSVYLNRDMRKYIGLIILGLAVGLVYYLTTQRSGEAHLRDEVKFAVNDVRNIDMISMKDREGNTILLEKKGEKWTVNKEYPASEPAIKLLLNETLSQIRIKGPVSSAARDNVIRSMVGRSKHIKIYEKGELIRNYYVGQPIPDQTGSYLHIEGSKTPYVAHILGFGDVLDPKFSTDIQDWYDHTVFDYKPSEITKITVKNYENPTESFELTRVDSFYSIMPPVANFSQSAARSYFSLFSFKNFEGYANYLKPETKATPFLSITALLKNGKSTEMKLHRKGNFAEGQTLVDQKGNTVVQDTERYFATFTGFKYLVTVQEYVFGKMIVQKSFFNAAYGQNP